MLFASEVGRREVEQSEGLFSLKFLLFKKQQKFFVDSGLINLSGGRWNRVTPLVALINALQGLDINNFHI